MNYIKDRVNLLRIGALLAYNTLIGLFKGTPILLNTNDPGLISLSRGVTGSTYSQWISESLVRMYPNCHVVVLTNINVSAKNVSFWAKVPVLDMPSFTKDVVTLRCKDKSEVVRLVDNISVDFADAKGYSSGKCIASNGDSV
jgi:hypothetical protein